MRPRPQSGTPHYGDTTIIMLILRRMSQKLLDDFHETLGYCSTQYRGNEFAFSKKHDFSLFVTGRSP